MFYKLTYTWFVNTDTVALVRVNRSPEDVFKKEAEAYLAKTKKPMPRALIYLTSGAEIPVFDPAVQAGLVMMLDVLQDKQEGGSDGSSKVEDAPFG